jgi:hypothetical protein
VSEFLHLYIQNALEFNEDLLPVVRSPSSSLQDVLRFCGNFRIAGIGFLLLSATVSEFHRRLQQSGAAYAAHLERIDESQKRGSQALPFFDAIVARDTDTATRIARSAPRAWKRDEEYEEDFLFPEYLMQRFFLGLDSAARAGLLDRWEKGLLGSPDSRLDVCRGLESADSDAFNGSLTSYLEERRSFYERLARKEILPPQEWDTEAQLSVEGLALVLLAESEGLVTEGEYLGIPSIARDRSEVPTSPDSWLRID